MERKECRIMESMGYIVGFTVAQDVMVARLRLFPLTIVAIPY